jgi:hypothetical protein
VRPYLGPPRDLLVRRFETDHRRAMRHLASAIATVAGGSMVALALFTPRASVGGRSVYLVGGVAAVVMAVWNFRRPSKRNVLLMLVLAWTIVVAAFVLW